MTMEKQDTKEKILLAACRLFAQRGFDGVTHRELASEAGVNSALINYYFRSKELLFEQVLEYCFQLTSEKYVIPKNSIDPLEGIKKMLRARLLPVFDEGPPGWFPRLIYHEMNSINSNKEEMRRKYLLPLRKRLTGFVARYLGQDEESLVVQTTVFNISSQWIMMNVARSRGRGFFAEGKVVPENVDAVINGVIEFISGGLLYIKKMCSGENGV